MTQVKNNVLHYWEKIDVSWRFAILAFVIARLFYMMWSWVIFTVQPVAVQNFDLSGEPILTIFKLENSEAHIYLREVNGDILTFQPAGPDLIMDRQSGTLWNISDGTAQQGPYSGVALAPAAAPISKIFPYYEVRPYQGSILLSSWQRFDANLYVTIAENGYGRIPGDTHFPPLLPLLIRILQPVVGNAFLAGLIISHLATLYMFKLLHELFIQWGGKTTGRRSLLFLLLYPASFFFFSVYSESLFLVTVLLALRNMKLRVWGWAGFWTFCSILTRLQGVALLLPMALLMYSDAPFLRKFSHWAGFIISGLGGLFYLFLRSRQAAGNAFPLVESEWQARLALPGETYIYAIKTILTGNATFIDFLNFVVATLFVILIIKGWRQIPLEYNLFVLVNLLILSIRVVETQPLNSMSRFSLTLFPVFFTLGTLGERPWVQRLIIYTFFPLHLYLVGQFFIWGWVA